MKHPYLFIYIGILIVFSMISFFLYAQDKRKSIKGAYRTKEKTLLLSSIIFGSIGGLLGMYQLRHKTKHWYFVFINWGAFIIHIALAFAIYKNL